AGGRDKRWPVEGFAEVVAQVARHHDLVVALHEGPADRDAVAALAERIDALVLKQPTLPHLAGALCHVAACLGNDSGVTHLAAAIGRPTVALFGAERLAWQPWARTTRVVVVEPGRLSHDVAAVARAVGIVGEAARVDERAVRATVIDPSPPEGRDRIVGEEEPVDPVVRRRARVRQP